MQFQEFLEQFRKDAYDTYRVKLGLASITGGVPADPKMIEGWINATNEKKSEADRKALVEATLAQLPEAGEDFAARAWTRFKQDEKGAYLEGRCLKAALKEAGNVVKSLVKVKDKKGEETAAKALKSKIAECVFVVEDRVYITKDGQPYKGELPVEERPVHVMTAQGPRTSLKRMDVLHDATLEFTVKLAKTGAVTEGALFAALSYLEYLGVGADRSQGSGKVKSFEVEQIAA